MPAEIIHQEIPVIEPTPYGNNLLGSTAELINQSGLTGGKKDKKTKKMPEKKVKKDKVKKIAEKVKKVPEKKEKKIDNF